MKPQPAFIPVAARQTLHQPNSSQTSPAPPKSQSKTIWPPSVRLYVQRAFETHNLVDGISEGDMQQKLKVVITEAAEKQALHSTNWDNYPLPQHLIQKERNQAAFSGMQTLGPTNPAYDSTSHHPKPILPFHTAMGAGATKKRKSSDMQSAQGKDSSPPWKKNMSGKPSLEDRITGTATTKKKVGPTVDDEVARDKDAVERRRQRFGPVTPTSPFLSSRDESPDGPPAGPVVGTCQILEKNYFRLTDAPPPETVRPLPVLEKALTLVWKTWKQGHNYTYACDQFKSLRQDLTVQHIRNSFTVKVYEMHARVALEMADLGEYNQCQTQLRSLYKMRLGGNPEEFLAYRILFIIYTCNRVDMNHVLAELTPADKRQPNVKHALQVRSALASGNYHRFFKLYDTAPAMGVCLLDLLVERERLAAMATICKTYKPDVSLYFLSTELAFAGTSSGDNAYSDDGPRECLEFLAKSGAGHLVEHKEHDIRVATGKAAGLFEAAKAGEGGRAAVAGLK